MERKLALLRGINVGGRSLKMAQLRDACLGLGWSEVETFIQSGNIIFRAPGNGAGLEAALEAAIAARFAMTVPVLVRTCAQIAACLSANPFRDEAREAPNRLMLLLAKHEPAAGAAAALEARGDAGEQVAPAGHGLWIWFPEGAGRSKLSPALIDRLVGSPATTRNHRTVARLAAKLKGSA